MNSHNKLIEIKNQIRTIIKDKNNELTNEEKLKKIFELTLYN